VQIVSVADFLSQQSTEKTITGPGLKKIQSRECPAKILAEMSIMQPRASVVATIGWKRSQLDDAKSAATDCWTALPFYIRASAAEEKQALNPAEK
jgi:hypothetical protein